MGIGPYTTFGATPKCRLVLESMPLAEAYENALMADDLGAAKKAAGALTTLIAKADALWLVESAALK